MKNTDVLSFVLPKEILEYFRVTDIQEKNDELHVYLEEINTVPPERTGRLTESKGFYPAKDIQDFPLRGKPVFLKIKRRRWRDKETGEEIMRDWKLAAEGTKYTKEFADFLKELAGQ